MVNVKNNKCQVKIMITLIIIIIYTYLRIYNIIVNFKLINM